MKKHLILTIGAPGSGKSTWALEQAAKSRKGNKTIVLNRDDVRAMLFGGKYKYSRENEGLVMNNIVNTTKIALMDNETNRIIIADTNLNAQTRKLFRSLVADAEAMSGESPEKDFQVLEEVFDVPWVELEKRNLTRGTKAVPKPVLRSMYLNMEKYLGRHVEYVPNPKLPKAVIFDLDGTLADNSHRNAFEYWKLDKDKPVEFVVNLAKMYSKAGYEIVCVSGRNAGDAKDNKKFHRMTKEWLDAHNIPWDKLHMRAWDDRRKDDVTKEEIFWNKIAYEYNVECAFDDRDRVCELWRRIGVNCCQVAFGEF
ncbi:polynucleotide kinase [Acinetobacter phage Acj9]|uniref:PseT polynucleotide 5'-kinase and 3'-phosphatase n=1 Tax=Acinetobacter phage Acj9 TaxID=760939 RepID=E5EQ04_9CAUD|nr:polynucleotide kinase [Acinetobacter phage Acj9]ADG60120.1 PseT polynucleotide 5'-kinase and 3'-phosphatase [Acinetobacter phage Acj9]